MTVAQEADLDYYRQSLDLMKRFVEKPTRLGQLAIINSEMHRLRMKEWAFENGQMPNDEDYHEQFVVLKRKANEIHDRLKDNESVPGQPDQR